MCSHRCTSMGQDKFGAAFKMKMIIWLGLGWSSLPFPGFLQSLLMFLLSKHQWDVPEILLGRHRADEDRAVEMSLKHGRSLGIYQQIPFSEEIPA